MTYEEIFSKSKELILQNDASGINEHLAVQVDITGEGEGAFYIELKDGNVYVEPYEYHDRDCKLILSGEDFIAICDGSLDAVKAFTNGKMKVEGDIDKALKMSEIFKTVQAAKAAETASTPDTKEEKPAQKNTKSKKSK